MNRWSKLRLCSLVGLSASLVAVVPDLAAQRGYGDRRPPARGDSRRELSGWAGWQLGATLDGDYAGVPASLHLEAATSYGAGIAFRVERDKLVELLWHAHPTTLELTDRPGIPDSSVMDLTVHYLHLGGQLELQRGPLRAFVMGSGGVTIFAPDATDVSNEVRFSLGAGLGLKAYLGQARRLGVRGQGRVWVTLVGASGGGIICGGGGCTGVVSGYGLFQGEFSGGAFLVF